MSKAISRRNFLMATGAVGAAGLLAACGSKPAASSTASSAASQAPAASADESLALSDGPVNLSISWWGGDSRHAAYQSALVSSVTAVAAPPADAQVNRAVRQGQAFVCGSSGSLRSSGRSGGRSSGLAAAGSQQTCSTDSAGSHQEVTTRNCLAHFCSPPNRKHLHAGGLHMPPCIQL